jgi:suppressor for copper-sensitivity B
VPKHARLHRLFYAAGLVAILLTLAAVDASAQPSSDWVRAEYGQVRLIAASEGLSDDGQITIGVQMRLYKGWKTYWRTPGETGIPATFDWSGSQNVAKVDLRWPAPTRFEDYGSQAFGYKVEVIFPVTAQAQTKGAPVVVDLDLQFGVCRDICMPVEAQLKMLINQTGTSVTPHAHHIAKFDRKVPLSGADSPLQIEGARYDSESEAVIVDLSGPHGMVAPDAVLELPAGFVQQAPVVSMEGNHATVQIPVIIDPSEEGLTGRTISIVAWDKGHRAVEKLVTIEP